MRRARRSTQATGEAVAPVDGLPTVALADNGKPTITVPERAWPRPPSSSSQPLIKGAGPVVTGGPDDQRPLHRRDLGHAASSSTRRGTAARRADIVIGQGQVIAGWDEGLVGQTVGSQVLLVVPPDKGYGTAGTASGGIKGTDTLVFVVDILDAY